MSNSPLYFFLNQQGIHFVERGKMIHKQDLCSYLWKGIVYPHQKLHNRFSILQIIKSLIHISCAFAASTRRKMTIVLQLIPKNLQLSEEISNGSLTLMEFCSFLLKDVNLRNILLSKMISQIVIDCQGNVFIDDTSLKLTRNWVCQPSPTILSHLIQAWTAKGVDTNGDDKVSVKLMNPSLFLVSRAFLTARAQAE